MKVLEVKSDNFKGLITYDAYNELCLTMSTGDFHTHTKKEVTVKDYTDVTTIDQLFEEDESYTGYFETLEDLGHHLFTENATNWDYFDVNQPRKILDKVIDFKAYACDQIKAQEVVEHPEHKGHWFFNS